MVLEFLKFLAFTLPLCFAVVSAFNIVECFLKGQPTTWWIVTTLLLWYMVKVVVDAGWADNRVQQL